MTDQQTQITIDTPVRRRIAELCNQRGVSLKELSLAVGKNHAYFQQYMHRGVPSALPEVVRLSLSAALGAPETDFREVVQQQKPASSGTLQALLSLSTHATEAIDRDYAYLSSDVRQKLKETI
jgi:transcriptional regulator with XRE-family HTH domain